MPITGSLGPIIRVAPDLLHVDDPEFFREVHGPQGKFLKSEYFYGTVGAPNALLSIRDPHEHKIRRAIVNPLFSQKSVNALASMVQDKLEQAMHIVRRRHLEGKPVDIQRLYRCISADIITTSMFGYSQDLIHFGDGTHPPLLTCLDGFLCHVHLMTHFPFLVNLAQKLPAIISKRILPGYVEFRKDCGHWIEKIMERREKGRYTDDNDRTVMFDLLLESNSEKDFQRLSLEQLIDEALIFITAGTDTTAYALSCATFRILHTPGVLAKLQEELGRVPLGKEGRFEWKYVQNLPYMTAVVKETLRISTPAIGPLPRVVPPEGARVQGNLIPGGTIILSTLITIHEDPHLFASPQQFLPERWLGDKGMELERWFVPFSKGSRQCVGKKYVHSKTDHNNARPTDVSCVFISLAYMELYLTLANFFGRFEMELFETDEKSMEWLDHGAALNASSVKVRAKPLVI
ncbi:hypothetical protein HO133_007666 [Letharia lupina]|uniref:Cytochrome P450 n=1 Tax=Letharia lupina TaxID=560253 RepID=A0A8H6CQX8_9LECA|nr:uncharacterized protein HO133_007666 [Letharia lupina]KAF6227938.1 hypothetical protein HO133_007666 [Letharia lupina]